MHPLLLSIGLVPSLYSFRTTFHINMSPLRGVDLKDLVDTCLSVHYSYLTINCLIWMCSLLSTFSSSGFWLSLFWLNLLWVVICEYKFLFIPCDFPFQSIISWLIIKFLTFCLGALDCTFSMAMFYTSFHLITEVQDH